ncbi:potassium channel family protein [Thiolinea disciformis]|uniref:potassium channel family protein n=1 Tax=Thiolinea disciformis TaxID=125614 RepID=UPI0003792DD6|nr:TrkA family potassium uptake protein [Thiolinea disciformis]
MGQFAVMGLGRFGSAAALELVRLGHNVVGIDSNPKMVNRIADELKYSAIVDVTDEQAIKELNVKTFDAVLVAIGGSLEASILCVLHLKNLGVQDIWVKAASRWHHAIVSKLGVSRVIHPEVEMGVKVAQSMSYPLINKFMPLGKNVYLVDIEIVSALHGLTIAEVLGKETALIKPILVRRNNDLHMPITEEFLLEGQDSLVLAAPLNALAQLAPRLE